MSWQFLFPWVLLLTCFDGFIANYFYPAVFFLLLRDFFVLGVYTLAVFQGRFGSWTSELRQRIGPVPWGCAIAFLAVCVLQILNPSLPGLAVGLLGFKVTAFYWPLSILSYAYAKDLPAARQLVQRIVYLSIPINLFGLYQFWAGPYFLVDTFGPGFERATLLAHIENAANPEDTFLRVIGTFASSGQYSQFLVINSMLTLSLALTGTVPSYRLVMYGALLLNFVSLLATGSRGGVLSLGLTFLCMWALSPHIRRGVWLSLLAAGGLSLGFRWMGSAVMQRFETLADTEMIRQRTFETTPLMFTDLLRDHPLGLGLGIASSASRYLLSDEDSSGLTEPFLIENHLSKLQLETGLFGVVAFYLLVLTLMLRWLRRWRTAPDAETRTFLVPLSAYCLTFMALSFIIGGFDSPPQGLFFWILVGMVARLSGQPKPV